MNGRLLLSLWAGLAIISGGTAQTASLSSVPNDPGESLGKSRAGSWGSARLHFMESFEAGTLDRPYESGFRWGSSRSRAIVRDDQYIVWKGKPRMEGPVDDPPRKWQGFSGSHALMFSYPAGKNGFSEQRFSLGRAYPEIWIGYWLRVPLNWEHGTGNTNNKFFAIWMDEYEYKGPGATGVIQIRNAGDGDSKISPYAMTRDNHHPGEEPGKTFIRSPEDQGRWMQVVIHAKMASGPSNKDGVFEMYRRWEGERQHEQIFRIDNWENYHVGGNEGFAHGYLMGWANATQPYTSEWLLDDFVFSDESLLGAAQSPGRPQKDSSPLVPNFVVP